MSKIAKNIRYLRSQKGLSQEALADELKITRARLGSYEESRSEPNIEILIKLSNYFQVAIDALVKGDLTKTNSKNLIQIGNNRLLFPVYIDKEENEMVEIVPAKASAGYLNGYSDPEYFERLQKMNLPFVPVGKHRAFSIKGDSMPPLKDGSYVIGKYVEALTDIRDGKTYVLLTKNEGIVYKRVYSNIKGGVLTLQSDNVQYEPYTIKLQDVLEVWEFTCCLNLSDSKPDELNMNSIMSMLRSMKIELASLKK